MNISIKTTDIRAIYKVLLWLLLSNNIAGIAMNFEMFVYSIIFIVGIPGHVLILYYFLACLRKKPVMFFLPHLAAVIFNIFIILVIDEMEIEKEIVGSLIWPSINIALSGAALMLIIINLFLIPPYNNEN